MTVRFTDLKTRILTLALVSLFIPCLNAQREMPEELETGTLEEQYQYLEDRTRIYQDFRAIREDMFQKIMENSNDSLDFQKNRVQELRGELRGLENRHSSVQQELSTTQEDRDEAIKNRDQLVLLGIPMAKQLYNSIVWIIIIGLAVLSVILFLTARRSVSTAKYYRNDLEELKEEYEAHRKSAREKYEQVVVKHHKELQKLKGR
jgi:hypothetical protein